MKELDEIEAALDKIARLGNEPNFGNSDGNILAQQTCLLIPALREKLEWQPIETAPKDGRWILWTHTERSIPCVIHWPTYLECFDFGFWMSLPQPPTEADDDKQ